MVRTACPLVFVCMLAASSVAAQEQVLPVQALVLPAEAGSYEILPPKGGSYGNLRAGSYEILAQSPPQSPPVASTFRWKPTLEAKPTRPTALVPLYAGFATLQALDYASTTSALQSGNAREANPMMKGIVGNRAAFVAAKAAATAGVIYAGEKMWKKNRVAAVIFVAALNGAMTAVVARNYSVR